MSQRRQMVRHLGVGGVESNTGNQPSHQPPIAASSMSHEKLAKMARSLVLLDLAAVVYYAVVAEPITTVAHCCALVMGACLSQLVNRQSGVAWGTTDTASESPSEPLLET